MIENGVSLLSQIKSKYILQKIFSLTFGEIKTVFKFVKYNKTLINKLELNIKDHYKFETEKKVYVGEFITFYFISNLVWEIILFLPFLIYIIVFYAKKKFKESMKEGYNKRKKNFVDIMDNIILLIYFSFIIMKILLNYLIIAKGVFLLKSFIKRRIMLIILIIDFIHLILYFIKFFFSLNIIKDASKKSWYIKFDISLLMIMTFHVIFKIPFLVPNCNEEKNSDLEITQEIFLNKINGIKMYYQLPNYIAKFNIKKKIRFIFDKENLHNYYYQLNQGQIDLIVDIDINYIR